MTLIYKADMKMQEEFNAAVQAKLNALDGEYVDFDGKNCGEDLMGRCSGWDGHSSRCDCGNRRVCWVADQTSDGKLELSAIAF